MSHQSKNVNPEDAHQIDIFRRAINNIITTEEYKQLPKNATYELLARTIVAYILVSVKNRRINLVSQISYGILLGYIFGRRSVLEERKSVEKENDQTSETESSGSGLDLA